MLVCWWWRFDWSFARLIAVVVATTYIILSSSKVQNGDILVAANPGPPKNESGVTLLVIRHEGRLARIEAKCWHVGAGDLTGALRVLRVPVVTSVSSIISCHGRIQNGFTFWYRLSLPRLSWNAGCLWELLLYLRMSEWIEFMSHQHVGHLETGLPVNHFH